MCSISRELIRRSERAFKQLQMFKLPDCYVQNKQHFFALTEKAFLLYSGGLSVFRNLSPFCWIILEENLWLFPHQCDSLYIHFCPTARCPLENQHPLRLSGEAGKWFFCRMLIVKTLRSDKDWRANMTKRQHECNCARSIVSPESASGLSKRLVFWTEFGF